MDRARNREIPHAWEVRTLPHLAQRHSFSYFSSLGKGQSAERINLEVNERLVIPIIELVIFHVLISSSAIMKSESINQNHNTINFLKQLSQSQLDAHHHNSDDTLH